MSKNAHFSSNDCNLHILNPNDVKICTTVCSMLTQYTHQFSAFADVCVEDGSPRKKAINILLFVYISVNKYVLKV